WTIVHCFFVQMDGFYLYGTDGKPIRPLSGEDIVRLAEHRYVPPPQEELEDKSKGDWVSKGLAMVQTLWFIAQCIARRLQHLSITQIEVVTLSYCVINMVVYACWWYKPLSVDLPIRVDITKFREQKQSIHADSQEEKQSAHADSQEEKQSALADRAQTVLADRAQTALADRARAALADRAEAALRTLSVWYEFARQTFLYLFFNGIGAGFGALHFVPWSDPFPSHTQHIFWRVCCVVLVVTPTMAPIVKLGLMLTKKLGKRCMMLLAGLFALLYLFARLVTMVISFTTLGSLPPTATDTVQWTRFIPHF
ncbi:hypothetical protein FIBSPDRAFT_690964, partial [Athelia psychrophila]